MNKIAKNIKIFVAVAVLMCLSTAVSATTDFGTYHFKIDVNGERFSVWGYAGDWIGGAFRLQDIAYILNGTSAQFDISTTDSELLEFFLVKGVSYTVKGTELQPLPRRYALFGSYGFVISGSYGFDEDPTRTVMIGIIEDNVPVVSNSIEVVKDSDGIFFPLWTLGNLLRFSIGRSDDGRAITITTP